MINTKIRRPEKKKIHYPCLMKSKGDSRYVLMTKECIGVIIHDSAGIYARGYYNEHWDMNAFYPFCGSIEISNQYPLEEDGKHDDDDS